MKIKLLGLVLTGVIFLLFFVWIFINSFIVPGGGKPTPIPVPTNFNIDYSRLYLLTPGKSALKDVIEVGGKPVSEKTVGKRYCLYYNTPSLDYKNVVCLENGVVLYVLENIFGPYRGSFDSYKIKYGSPDITYAGDNVDFPWYIFLKNGVGVQSSAGAVTALLHFIPQTEENFYKNIGVGLGILKTTPTPSENLPVGEPAI